VLPDQWLRELHPASQEFGWPCRFDSSERAKVLGRARSASKERLMKKTQSHEPFSISQPRTGPMAAVIAVKPDQTRWVAQVRIPYKMR
jgi:hypothetical protein